MRKLWPLLLLLAGIAVAGPINLQPGTIVTFTDCSSSGSVAQTIAGGSYVVTVTDEDTWLCLADSAATCASGGTKFPKGTAIHLAIGNGGQSAACRSTASTGDIQFTKGG